MQDYHDLLERQSVFEDLAAHWSGSINISGDGPPERFTGAFVTANFLDVLRVQPVLGRNLRPEEDRPGEPPKVMLSFDAWQNRYGSDHAVLGKTVTINGEQGTVLGVMPEGFTYPENAQLWVGMREDPLASRRREGRLVSVLGRLKPRTTPDAAVMDLTRIATQLEKEHPDTNEGMGMELVTVVRATIGPQFGNFLGAMMGAAILVLLVACANVANLLLARAATRSKDAALRAALGGSRIRVVLSVIVETLILAGAGALLAIGISYLGVDLFDGATESSVSGKPTWMRFAVDLPAFGFVLSVSALTALAAGVAPVVQVARGNVSGILKDESRGLSSLSQGRLSRVLVIGEVALSCALLVGAGLMTKSIINLSQRDFSFNTEDVFTARVEVFEAEYPKR